MTLWTGQEAASRLPVEPRWRSYYEEQLAGRLRRAIEHVRSRPSAELKPHFHSLLTLIERSRSRPALGPLAADLISELHPMPLNWGEWAEWLQTLRFGVLLYERLNRPGQQASLMADLSRLLFELGRSEEAMALAEKTVAFSRERGVVSAFGMAGANTVHKLISMGHIDRAAEMLRTLQSQLPAFIEHALPLDYLMAESRLGMVYSYLLGQQGNGQQGLLEINGWMSKLLASPEVDQKLISLGYHFRAGIRRGMGDFQQSIQDCQLSQDALGADGDLLAEISLVYGLGSLYYFISDLASAAAFLLRGIALCEQMQADWLLVRMVGTYAVVKLNQGHLQEALRYNQRQTDIAYRLQDALETSRCHSNRGNILNMMGEYETALEHLQIGLKYCLAEKLWLGQTLLYANLSVAFAGLGQRDQAIEMARTSIEIAEKRIHRMRGIGLRALAYCVRPPESELHIGQALEEARDRDQPYDEAACLLYRLSTDPGHSDFEQQWQRAVALLNQCGAAQWLNNFRPGIPLLLPLLG